MIDIQRDRLLSIDQVCSRVPGRRGNVVYRTVWIWMLRGVCGVKLESQLVGGRRYTSEEALQRFLARLAGGGGDGEELDGSAGGPGPRPTPPPVRSTPARERRRQELLTQEMEQLLGIKR